MNSKILRFGKYRPNFEDPRVKHRVELVLNWARPILIEKKPRPVSSEELTKIFGNQHQRLSGYLRANILNRSGMYRVGSKFFDYSIRREGYAKLAAAVAAEVKSDAGVASDIYSPIALGMVEVEYSEPTPGKRRYHYVQNLPRYLRAEVFSGWFDYDIESAAPNLVLQFARRGLPSTGADPYPALQRMVNDKAQLRAHVGQLTALEPSAVKRIINGLFFGAKLQASNRTAIFRAVGEDTATLVRLKDDEAVTDLVREAKAMWEQVLSVDGGSRTGSAVQPAAKRMAIYMSLEREVIEAMEAVMSAAGIRYVLMHDGFMADRQVSRQACQAAVLVKSGFVVSLSEERLSGQKAGSAEQDEPDVIEAIDQ